MAELLSEDFRALLWWCGDEICDCTQPIIERRSQRAPNGLWNWDRVWEGTFHSAASSNELAAQRKELNEACKRYGIVLDEPS